MKVASDETGKIVSGQAGKSPAHRLKAVGRHGGLRAGKHHDLTRVIRVLWLLCGVWTGDVLGHCGSCPSPLTHACSQQEGEQERGTSLLIKGVTWQTHTSPVSWPEVRHRATFSCK